MLSETFREEGNRFGALGLGFSAQGLRFRAYRFRA